MNKWPLWIPNPNAWLSAAVLILLARGIAVLARVIVELGAGAAEISPRLQIILYLLAWLLPIGAIAIVHHCLHLALDKLSPTTQAPEMRGSKGIFPGVMSWWEGLFGWLAIALSFVISNAVLVIISPEAQPAYKLLAWWEELKNLFALNALLRLIIAAYLYQFDSIVRQHLIAVGAENRDR